MASERKPRLCVMTKGDKGYGFHLHGEKGKTGQYIRKVEPDSPAEEAGLRAGDRVVAVNGVNVERETHHQVVQRIKGVDNVTRLLVVDQETHECLRNLRLTPTEEMAVPRGGAASPVHSSPPPQSTPSPSPSVPSSPGKKKRENGSVSLQSMLQRSQSCQAQKPTGRLTSPAVKKAVQTQVEEAPTTTHQARSRLHGDPTEFAPRLCHLVRADTRYGFNLHSHRSRPGQYIRLLDAGSPADQAGLRPQDRIVEVNGVNVEVMRHSEVVAFIKKGGDETWLLVVDPDTDEYFKMKGITPTVSHVKDYSGPYVSKSSPSPLTNGSSSPHSFRSKNSVRSNGRQAAGKERGRYSDPFADIGLNATAAEVKQKLTAKEKRKAPEMDWMKKYELFSNF
ncbi:LOW QUALITY PROTEIN: Na(+)/H(+) exchange regulatory cofactor NHE-RF2-like [Entelurus aequoreus]|uniref:LOW QUALITY PROTEIN: Na(+)/H(+) exchange regulatory cofactor NHE-RF2-like n=1 Tax=Entelurus aequoreus TaxID=161455 RepID=UPI002B1CF50F|nr:LOW QUALITY PROTEIN: Na(+)/H(+) exchange regulatory cofactor NHE-RF2-like [Entelurus aequoreus]